MIRHQTRRGVASLLGPVILVAGLSLLAIPTTNAAASPSHDDPATDYARMLLVLDSSGSMSEPASGGVTKLAAAKESLTQVVDRLPESAYVGLRVYGAEVFSKRQPGACTDSQLVVEPGTDNRDALRQAIETYRAYGETPIGYALRQAAKDIGSEGSRSIVLVSDGIATCQPDPCEVAAEITAKGIDLQVDAVGLGVTSAARRQLECIAEKGGGTYYDADSADEIVKSLSHVAERAVRPFTLAGAPVTGSPTPAGAPLLEPGQYVDTLGGSESARDTLHYTVERTTPRSTLHFSAMTQGVAGDPTKDWEDLEVTTETTNGVECSNGRSSRINETSSVVSAVVSVGPDSGDAYDKSCATSGKITFAVTRGALGPDQATPLGLMVAEEPPVTTTAGLPPADEPENYIAPDISGAPQPIVGGASFDAATPVETGSYSATTVPGEVQFFKVSLDWGQQLSVQADFPGIDPALEDDVTTLDRFTTLTQIGLYNPLRGELGGYVEGVDSQAEALGDTPDKVSAITPPVRYLNRERYYDNTAYLPGDYYIAIAMDHYDETFVLPYTLSVEVKGRPAGEPTYVDDATYQGPDSDSSTSTDDEAGPDTDDQQASGNESSGDGHGLQIAAATGLLGVGAGCLIWAVVLFRRRTSAGGWPTG